jgi:hypothetical protein
MGTGKLRDWSVRITIQDGMLAAVQVVKNAAVYIFHLMTRSLVHRSSSSGEFALYYDPFVTVSVCKTLVTEFFKLICSVSRQILFGAVSVSVRENLLNTQLATRLASILGITPDFIKNRGATNIVNNIPIQYSTTALVAYNNSLPEVFQVALYMARHIEMRLEMRENVIYKSLLNNSEKFGDYRLEV